MTDQKSGQRADSDRQYRDRFMSRKFFKGEHKAGYWGTKKCRQPGSSAGTIVFCGGETRLVVTAKRLQVTINSFSRHGSDLNGRAGFSQRKAREDTQGSRGQFYEKHRPPSGIGNTLGFLDGMGNAAALRLWFQADAPVYKTGQE